MGKKKLILLAGVTAMALNTSAVYAEEITVERPKETTEETTGETTEETTKDSADEKEPLHITNEDIIGRWATGTIEQKIGARFGENGDCCLTSENNGEVEEIYVLSDGTVLSAETGVDESIKVYKIESDTLCLYYIDTDYEDGVVFFPDGTESEYAYLVEFESELFISDDKFIMVDSHKAYDYDIVENTICCIGDNDVIGAEVLFYDDNLFICQDIADINYELDESYDVMDDLYDAAICVRRSWLQKKAS